MTMLKSFTLGVGSLLDFGVPWGKWLAPGETITAHNVTATPGVDVDRSDHDSNGVVTIWLRGGQLGYTATVCCQITTNEGRHDSRSFTVSIVER